MFKLPQVKLAAGHKFDRDVELLIYYLNAHQPTVVVEAGQTSASPCESVSSIMILSVGTLTKILICAAFSFCPLF